jgi:hypothetical protein
MFKELRLSACLVTFALAGCNPFEVSNTLSNGIFGVWVSNQGFVLTIDESNKYQLCRRLQCSAGNVKTLPVANEVVLVDFYASDLGKELGLENYGDAEIFADFKKFSDRVGGLLFIVPPTISREQRFYCGGTPSELNAAEGGVCFRQIVSFPPPKAFH